MNKLEALEIMSELVHTTSQMLVLKNPAHELRDRLIEIGFNELVVNNVMDLANDEVAGLKKLLTEFTKYRVSGVDTYHLELILQSNHVPTPHHKFLLDMSSHIADEFKKEQAV